jgi:hypothetical protein
MRNENNKATTPQKHHNDGRIGRYGVGADNIERKVS